jgi:hypothetical protein
VHDQPLRRLVAKTAINVAGIRRRVEHQQHGPGKGYREQKGEPVRAERRYGHALTIAAIVWSSQTTRRCPAGPLLTRRPNGPLLGRADKIVSDRAENHCVP